MIFATAENRGAAMIEIDGKIIVATESELLSKWLDEEFMSFPEYKAAMERAGCIVKEAE